MVISIVEWANSREIVGLFCDSDRRLFLTENKFFFFVISLCLRCYIVDHQHVWLNICSCHYACTINNVVLIMNDFYGYCGTLHLLPAYIITCRKTSRNLSSSLIIVGVFTIYIPISIVLAQHNKRSELK